MFLTCLTLIKKSEKLYAGTLVSDENGIILVRQRRAEVKEHYRPGGSGSDG